MQKRLPDIRQLSDFYLFKQDSAPALRAREAIELLTMETPRVHFSFALATKQSRFKSGRL